jgi:small basic protein
MRKPFQNKAGILGFWIGIIIFLLLNFILSSTTDEFSNITTDYGFPFLAYRTNLSSNYSTYVFWYGLIANIVIALAGSFAIGKAFDFDVKTRVPKN